MAASDELADKRAHKGKGAKINDMTIAIGVASLIALFIFVAMSRSSQVGQVHALHTKRTPLPSAPVNPPQNKFAVLTQRPRA